MTSSHYGKFLSANVIRRTFLDYFFHNGHSFIPSSSVKPFSDSSLEFVNAGMNQFKNIFLGLEGIPCSRAANSQKCIRVGGKHNDLNVVGHDTYHHTFFEMLGNWSFNDYFKEEACRLAWTLVTSQPFGLNPKRLYVTYFGGDAKSNLQPDLETKEIWLKIGIDKDRILPFGLKDNFWEMGHEGPCGPSTEIHYDHIGFKPRPSLVNMDSPDLTELWNIVFIQYNRLSDGRLEKLDKHFVDTGMGFERLVALLQGKSSNYDSDLFLPYFSAISKYSGLPDYRGKFGESDQDGLDTAFRILADHSRMITIALSDNIFPDDSHSLRRVIRKALLTSEKVSKGNGVNLLIELSKIAIESFAETFPETGNKYRQIECILCEEDEIWKTTQKKVKIQWEELISKCKDAEVLTDERSPGLISSIKALNDEKLTKGRTIPRDLALAMYDRFGLHPHLIHHLATSLGYSVDSDLLEKDISELKQKNKQLLYSRKYAEVPYETIEYIVNSFQRTNDSFKSQYSKSGDKYSFGSLKSRIKTILVDGHCADKMTVIENESPVAVLLDRTNMWTPFNGESDKGQIVLYHNGSPLGKVVIDKVINIAGYIYHFGTLLSTSSIPVQLLGELQAEVLIDYERRLGLMRNTTAAHLFYVAASECFVTSLKSIVITHNNFSLTFSVHGQNVSNEEIMKLEEMTNTYIKSKINVDLLTKPSSDVMALSDVVIPPFVNPNMKDLHLVNFKTSNKNVRLVTCGPNVLNTSDIGEMCLVKVEKKRRNREISVVGVCGENVATALTNSQALLNILYSQESSVEKNLNKVKDILKNNPIPWKLNPVIEEKLAELKTQAKKQNLQSKVQSLMTTLHSAEQKGEDCFIAFAGEDFKVEKLFQTTPRLPVLIFAVNQKCLVARCAVPEDWDFSAKDWMTEVCKNLGSETVPSKKHGSQDFLMKPLKLKNSPGKDQIEQFISTARSVVEHLLKKS